MNENGNESKVMKPMYNSNKMSMGLEYPDRYDFDVSDLKELPVTVDYDSDESLEKNLEKVWRIMNIYEENPLAGEPVGNPREDVYCDIPCEQGQDWIIDSGVRHTSMSMGDAVKIGDRIFVAVEQGFKEVRNGLEEYLKEKHKYYLKMREERKEEDGE